MFHEGWLKPSYEDIHNACHEAALAMEAYKWSFHRILGVTRGGMFPAMILSHMLNLPVTPVQYSSKAGKGENKQHDNVLPPINSEERILVVDDICDSGNTLYELKNKIEIQGPFVYTFALYYKRRPTPVIIPDFTWRIIPEDAGWVIFPYERNEHIETCKETIIKAFTRDTMIGGAPMKQSPSDET